MDWFALSLIAMVLYGIQNFIYKIVAEKNLNTGLVLMTGFATAGMLSGILLYLNFVPLTGIHIFVFAAIQASFYLMSRYVKIESFKYLPTVVALPISRTHFAITALLGIIILKEQYTLSTILGISLFLIVVLILSGSNAKKGITAPNFRAGFALAVATAIFTTVSELMVKIAATQYNVLLFMFLSYVWLILPSHLLNLRQGSNKRNKKPCVVYGFFIGLFNFASFFTVMSALKTGPASVIFPVIGLNMLVTVFLAVIVYHEKITSRGLMALILSVIAIILLRH